MSANIYTEIRRLKVAIGFFTRIPMGTIPDFENADLDCASKYLPWIGLFLGIFMMIIFWIAYGLWNQEIASVLTISVGFLLTGCFHEDGLADVCDGFGGGFSKYDKLKIMKDSRVGTYGSIGLMVIFSIKILILAMLPMHGALFLLVIGSTLSRTSPLFLIKFCKYIEDHESSRSKPVAQSLESTGLIFGLLAIVPILLWEFKIVLIAFITAIIIFLITRKLCIRHVGGYTGDILGFSQQLSEASIYLVLSAIWLSI